MDAYNYLALERRIGYSFNDRELLRNALTHSSFANEAGLTYCNNNERLEFIGDAYLDAFVGMKMFTMLPDKHEGVLSKRRADVVCEKSLAEVAREVGLSAFILLGKGESRYGGRDKDSILADAMEAVIGAIVIDGGVAEAERVVLDLFNENITLSVQGRLNQDYKSILQEKLQEKYKSIDIEYREVAESGPDHAKKFIVAVHALGKDLGIGKGRSKKEAEQEAARNVLERKQ